MFAKLSPDGRMAAYVVKNNIYVENLADGMVRALTTDGTDDVINGTSDWVNGRSSGSATASAGAPTAASSPSGNSTPTACPCSR